MNDSPVLALQVSWDEVYPVVHISTTLPGGGYRELVPIPFDLAARYATLSPAWDELQRDLKRYLKTL